MKFFRKICLGLVFAVVFLLSPLQADAASLFVSTAAGPFNVGSVFSVEIYVSSVEEAMNAASGVINFPKDRLEVVSISKSGSIFSLWAQEPTFSNAAGTVNFEGVVLNPGYTGTKGRLMSINFRVKSKGSATVGFISGSVLANDGQGTEILKNMGNAQFNFGTDEAPKPEPNEIITPKPVDKSVDKAKTEKSAVVEAPIEVIEPPVIKDYTEDVQIGQAVVIRGSTYPNSDVLVWIGGEKEEGKKFKIKSDETGSFIFINTEKLSEGTYTAWASVADLRGAQSLPSERIYISVSKMSMFQASNTVIALIAVLVLALIIVSILLFWLWHGVRKLSAMRRVIRKATHDAESTLQKSFNMLRDDISRHVAMLEKAERIRGLTKEEEKIMKELRRDLDDTERFTGE